jgi:structural maintenance of chromosome 4
MFELADRLVGIYKTHDATKSVTINPRMFAVATASKGKLLAAASRASESSEGTGREREKVAFGDATNRMP